MEITKEMLIEKEACEKQIKIFEEVFPNGAVWPDDVNKAVYSGLDVK